MADHIPAQLHMRRPHLEGLPDLVVPEGYRLRSYQPGDEAPWAEIMNHSIGSKWTEERCRDELTSRREFRPKGFFVATHEERPVATACAWVREAELPGEGTVHMVGALPEHRGKGLGTLVTLAVVRWFAANGFQSARLSTDDWREPAVATYLKLRFEPVVFDEDHERRWRALREKLGFPLD